MSITFNLKQIKDLVELFGDETSDEEDVEITVFEVGGDANAHSGPGLYAHYDEYPEEGMFLLGDNVQEMPGEGG